MNYLKNIRLPIVILSLILLTKSAYSQDCGMIFYSSPLNEIKASTTRHLQQWMIAGRYREGDTCFVKNKNNAIEWYQLAINNGNKDAVMDLAHLYFYSNMSTDAFSYFSKATSDYFRDKRTDDFAHANFHLGLYYLDNGGNINKDLIKAEKYLKISSDFGEKKAMPLYAQILMDQAKIDKEGYKRYQKVLKLLEASENSEPISNYYLAKMYELGLLVRQNSRTSADYIIRALQMKDGWEVFKPIDVIDEIVDDDGSLWSEYFVGELQIKLKRLGLYKGKVDLQLGPRTHKALIKLTQSKSK